MVSYHLKYRFPTPGQIDRFVTVNAVVCRHVKCQEPEDGHSAVDRQPSPVYTWTPQLGWGHQETDKKHGVGGQTKWGYTGPCFVVHLYACFCGLLFPKHNYIRQMTMFGVRGVGEIGSCNSFVSCPDSIPNCSFNLWGNAYKSQDSNCDFKSLYCSWNT